MFPLVWYLLEFPKTVLLRRPGRWQNCKLHLSLTKNIFLLVLWIRHPFPIMCLSSLHYKKKHYCVFYLVVVCGYESVSMKNASRKMRKYKYQDLKNWKFACVFFLCCYFVYTKIVHKLCIWDFLWLWRKILKRISGHEQAASGHKIFEEIWFLSAKISCERENHEVFLRYFP